MNSKTKVIILAGGQGKRLKPLTNNKPKCMVKIFNKSILEHQINCLRECGITDITVITGYRSDKIKIPNINYVKNKNYKNTNMTTAVFLAQEKLKGSVIIAYGDIIYESKILKKLLSEKNDLAVVVDKNWKNLWSIRFDNPLNDAESLKLNKKGYIIDIGQKIKNIEESEGQFIGLVKFQKKGLELIKKHYEDFRLQSQNGTNILNPKLSFECSFMTDLLQALIKRGMKLKSVPINGGWLELDTINDLEIYNKLYSDGKLSKLFKLKNI